MNVRDTVRLASIVVAALNARGNDFVMRDCMDTAAVNTRGGNAFAIVATKPIDADRIIDVERDNEASAVTVALSVLSRTPIV